ncbi:hypothetical protein [Parvimonas micra]|uniref:hypothetical protein n=1 Tax=Parvimonas micra TaxID=33033 RepID=UPI000F6699A1|nr:hypothetical protein [Parvimonas micra]RSB90219.1 hypothetical protein EGS00_00060 [Parvimonas micra]
MISYKAAFSHCKKFQEKPFLDLRATHLQEIIDNCPAGYPTKRKLRLYSINYMILQDLKT